jgi:hypothetical protein
MRMKSMTMIKFKYDANISSVIIEQIFTKTKPIKHPPTLCWKCKKASGGLGCEWASRFEPVKGWDAVPTTIPLQNGLRADSFCVKSCPKFEKG